MEYRDITKEISYLLRKLDDEEFPELYDLLDQVQGRQLLGEDSDYVAFVQDIMNSDRDSGDFPDYIIEYVRKILQFEIEKGNHHAMNYMGAVYYDGDRGFEQDFTKAVEYYKMAADNGSRQAQENLGYCYYYGRNVEIDYEKAFNYFALGAFDGHLISVYKIADMYANGYYVQKNEREAYNLYKYCEEKMDDKDIDYIAGPVYLRLGKAYLNGKGTEVDLKEALRCFMEAEKYLYEMVRSGSVMYKKSLMASIDGQNEAREKLMKELPGKQWLDGKKD